MTESTSQDSWVRNASRFKGQGTLTGQLVTNRDGSAIRSEFSSDAAAGWDERHTVATPDGVRISFETAGTTQTIRDASSGDILSAATWTPQGAVPEARVQPAFAPQVYAAEKAIEAATTLFTWFAMQNTPDRIAVMDLKADEYRPGGNPAFKAIWVGQLTKDETEAACPRFAEVQERTNYAADAVTREGNTWYSPSQYGTAVHKRLSDAIKALRDPNFRAEVSFLKSKIMAQRAPSA